MRRAIKKLPRSLAAGFPAGDPSVALPRKLGSVSYLCTSDCQVTCKFGSRSCGMGATRHWAGLEAGDMEATRQL